MKRLLWGLVILIIYCIPSSAACTSPCVNETSGLVSTTAGATQNFTVTAAASGNFVVLNCGTGSATNGVSFTGVALTNTTWGVITTQTSGGVASDRVHSWLGLVSGGTSGTALSINISASVVAITCDMTEWTTFTSNLDTLGVGQNTGGTTGVLTTNSQTQGSTSVNNELLLAVGVFFASSGSISSQPTGYTALAFSLGSTTGITLQLNFLTTNSIGNQSPQWTYSSTPRSTGLLLPFKPAAAGGSFVANQSVIVVQ
jgi:hypothetical protein